uniref:G-protein coupled receptors family 1 profile domain-containing protein n=1 Tax=Globodera rostochiensis TaxID=31243 RepID=A0A914IH64_GLORO
MAFSSPFRRLRSRCNALLAFDAACAGIAFVTNIVTFAVVCSAQKFIKLRQCFWLQFVPTICLNLLLNAMLAVGIERLVSVVAPFWVNTLNSTLYVGTLILLCFAYAVYAMVRLYPISLIETPDMPVACTMNDLYQGVVGTALLANCMLFTGLTILCYAIIWATLCFKKVKQNIAQTQIDYTKRIFKCLLVNVMFVSTGYFLNVAFLILLTRISLSQVQIVFAIYILGIFTTISGIGTVPTLYKFSFSDQQNNKLNIWQQLLVLKLVTLSQQHKTACKMFAETELRPFKWFHPHTAQQFILRLSTGRLSAAKFGKL